MEWVLMPRPCNEVVWWKVSEKNWKENHMHGLVTPTLSMGFWTFKSNDDHSFC